MVSKELKRLSRRELVDIIYQLKKNEQEMQDQITTLQESLQERRIRMSVAGSIAEAVTDMTNIFATAQRTADLYLQEISCMKQDAQLECTRMVEDAKLECARMIEDAEAQVVQILSEGEKQYALLNNRYESDYQKWQQLCAEIRSLEDMKKRVL